MSKIGMITTRERQPYTWVQEKVRPENIPLQYHLSVEQIESSLENKLSQKGF